LFWSAESTKSPQPPAMGEHADHTPQGAWAPVAGPDEVEASVVQRPEH